MTELCAISLAALEGNENEFIIYSEGSRGIDQCNGQTVSTCSSTFPKHLCVYLVFDRKRRLLFLQKPILVLNTGVELKSIKGKSNLRTGDYMRK